MSPRAAVGAKRDVDVNVPRTEPEPLVDGRPYYAPEWFKSALLREPTRSEVDVKGAPIEVLEWGKPGNPGLLLLHGKGAHADWWSFLAPYFADDFHVVALSWSGMGRSGWRDDYPIEIHVDEIDGIMEAFSLFKASQPPTVVAHSFATFPAILYGQKAGSKLGSMIIVDPPIFSPESIELRRERRRQISSQEHRRFATFAEAIRRFRFAPPQSCEHLYIADFIARNSLKQVEEDSQPSWTWRFDKRHWVHQDLQYLALQLGDIECPLTFILGDRSTLRTKGDDDYMRSRYPKGTREMSIADAAHHVMVDQPLAFVSVLRAILAQPV